MKPLMFLIFAIVMWGSSCSSAISQQYSNENAEAEVVRLPINESVVLVKHADMEVSEVCPEVLMRNAGGAITDRVSLCEVNVNGYRVFDARKDFAFIQFKNYRRNEAGDALLYSLDLALLRGDSFVAECRLAIVGEELGAPRCERGDERIN
jgi:hypothetical protein